LDHASELLPIRTYHTADGLSRFDGDHFVNYGVTEGLPHQYVSSFLETRSGDQNSITALLEARLGEIWPDSDCWRRGPESNR
jgi:hypothetical protein